MAKKQIEDTNEQNSDLNRPEDLLPRPKRRKRRAKEDRGLPPDEQLVSLTKDYLEHQRKLWPEIANAGLLPLSEEAAIREMVEDFKRRHRGGQITAETVEHFKRFCQAIGSAYARYSCDNSSPTSIRDQLINALRRAKEEGRFIPWACVFADYSISGRDSSRRGYLSLKAVLSKLQIVETLYVDDFTRPSRDELEWWRLAAMVRQHRKRMIGASDHFDLSSPHWDIQVTVFGLLSRLFLRGLREKVVRGMKGTARLEAAHRTDFDAGLCGTMVNKFGSLKTEKRCAKLGIMWSGYPDQTERYK